MDAYQLMGDTYGTMSRGHMCENHVLICDTHTISIVRICCFRNCFLHYSDCVKYKVDTRNFKPWMWDLERLWSRRNWHGLHREADWPIATTNLASVARAPFSLRNISSVINSASAQNLYYCSILGSILGSTLGSILGSILGSFQWMDHTVDPSMKTILLCWNSGPHRQVMLNTGDL